MKVKLHETIFFCRLLQAKAQRCAACNTFTKIIARHVSETVAENKTRLIKNIKQTAVKTTNETLS